jgi:hypothetical protein
MNLSTRHYCPSKFKARAFIRTAFFRARDLRWVWISRIADGAMPNSRRKLWGMRLDTSLGQAEAIGFYKSARFKPIADRALIPFARRHRRLAAVQEPESLRPEWTAS